MDETNDVYITDDFTDNMLHDGSKYFWSEALVLTVSMFIMVLMILLVILKIP